MRALFCTDGSKISFVALSNFSRFVNKDIVIDTICVIDWSFLPDDVVIEETGFVTNCRNVADSILDRARNFIQEIGMQNGDVIKYCGAVTDTIIEQVGKVDYDFIILGSHGKKGFQRWLGSVSREIIDSVNVPVYVSKFPAKSAKLLFATNGADIDNLVLDITLSKLDLQNCEIYICSVSENPDLLFLDGTLDSNWLLAIQTQQEIYAEHAVNNFKKKLSNRGITINDTKVMEGIPAVSIIDYIKEKEIDLVVLGANAKSRMQNFLLDSVSKRVIENAHCDSLIIKNNLNN